MKAIWNGETIAQSDQTIVVEGNHYFPVSDVDANFLVPSDTTTSCPWKGIAHYYTISVDGSLNTDACWYYPEPKEEASHIKDRLAFWKGVEIID